MMENEYVAETEFGEAERRQKLTITLRPTEVTSTNPASECPTTIVVGINLTTTHGSSPDTSLEQWYSSADQVEAFLKGIQAGAQMTGGPYVRMPEIPRRIGLK